MASDFMLNKKILFFRQTVPLAYLSYFKEHLLFFFLNKCFFLDCSSNVKIFCCICLPYIYLFEIMRGKNLLIFNRKIFVGTTTKGIDHHNHTCRLLKNINILRG